MEKSAINNFLKGQNQQVLMSTSTSPSIIKDGSKTKKLIKTTLLYGAKSTQHIKISDHWVQ